MEDMAKTLVGLHALDKIQEADKLKREKEETAWQHRQQLDSAEKKLKQQEDEHRRKEDEHRRKLESSAYERDNFRKQQWAAEKKAKEAQEAFEQASSLLHQPLEKIAQASSAFRYNFTQFKALHAAQMLQALALREQCEAYAKALGKTPADMNADIDAASQRVLSGQSPHAEAALDAKKVIVEAQKLRRLKSEGRA